MGSSVGVGIGVKRVGVGGGVGVGKAVVLASNCLRVKSSCTLEHLGQMGRVWDKWACGD